MLHEKMELKQSQVFTADRGVQLKCHAAEAVGRLHVVWPVQRAIAGSPRLRSYHIIYVLKNNRILLKSYCLQVHYYTRIPCTYACACICIRSSIFMLINWSFNWTVLYSDSSSNKRFTLEQCTVRSSHILCDEILKYATVKSNMKLISLNTCWVLSTGYRDV